MTSQKPMPNSLSSASPSRSAPSPRPNLPRRDILWLGAHKTGTTYLQELLADSTQALADAQYLYIGMQAFRSLYTRPLLYPSATAQKTPVAPLPRHAEETMARYLLFDENVLSLVQDALHPSGLYPEGAERALHVATTLDLEAPDIVLGIRGFAQYLPSLYCEVLKSMPFRPFSSFNSLPLTALSWYAVIDRLRAAFPQSRLRIYRAEDLRGQETALLAWIAGLPPPRIGQNKDPHKTPNKAARREGFSHAAVTALHHLHQETGKVSPADLAQCLKRHPRSAQNTAYTPWTSRQSHDLDLVYQLDLDAIAKLDRVEIWTPASG
ncbi:hypothetical protein [Pseudophaeobacter sp.]|jgi:hypothetical protein|uniref:hypothetical protein n=1 Tax=Pseudophaeobacter sp. TaxID=1971739 RepID=UPI0025EC655A|nr:hypothetical protein [uncultured Pseudophaeobacter sp.]